MRFARMAMAVAVTLTTTACDTDGIDGLANDDALAGLPFSRAITISELDSVIGEGPIRIEVELRAAISSRVR